MPTDPTARDVETARALSPCGAVPPCDKRPKRWGTCHPCGGCVLRDVIARALATARAEERGENCRALCAFCRGDSGLVVAGVRRRQDTDPRSRGAWVHPFANGEGSVPCTAATLRAREGAA